MNKNILNFSLKEKNNLKRKQLSNKQNQLNKYRTNNIVFN